MRKSRTSWAWLFTLCSILGVGELAVADESDSVEWLTEYTAARREGIKLNRPLLLFVTSDECRYCVKMRKSTFANQEVVSDLRQDFVSAKLKLHTDDQLARDLKVNIFPTTMIISPQGKILDYARGYLSKDQLLLRMRNAMSEANSIASSR